MKIRCSLVLLSFSVFTGCATLNKTAINNGERSSFSSLILIPSYDIYDIRIDLIRQTNEEQVDDESCPQTDNVPYHPVGFYLGNGLFIDLNDNLSLLVPKLFNINNRENFTIEKKNPQNLPGSKTIYIKTDNLFQTKNGGIITTSDKDWIEYQDSIVRVKKGFLSSYKIIEKDESLIYYCGLDKITLQPNNQGYFYKTFLSRREYYQLDNEIHIGNRYIIRNHGDMIEILSIGLFNTEFLQYRIIKSANQLYVYDRNYRGLEITVTEKQISVNRNSRKLSVYMRY